MGTRRGTHRGPDRKPGLTAADIAEMAGTVTRPTVASVAARAGVPNVGRRGIAVETGRRLAAALSVHLLHERSARALAEDPEGFLRATYELQDLVREIIKDRDANAAASIAA